MKLFTEMSRFTFFYFSTHWWAVILQSADIVVFAAVKFILLVCFHITTITSVFQLNQDQPVLRRFSCSTCSEREPLGILVSGSDWWPSCHPTDSVGPLKETRINSQSININFFSWRHMSRRKSESEVPMDGFILVSSIASLPRKWRCCIYAGPVTPLQYLLVHGHVTIIFVVSVGLSVCLFVQSFSQPSLIRFQSN